MKIPIRLHSYGVVIGYGFDTRVFSPHEAMKGASYAKFLYERQGQPELGKMARRVVLRHFAHLARKKAGD